MGSAVIHIAPDLSYLFANTRAAATVLCGRLAQDVFAAGEFVGIAGNLPNNCVVCLACCWVEKLHTDFDGGADATAPQ